MCGVAGIFSYGGEPADLERLAAMSEALVHRGPDGEGTWRSDDGSIALAHRRLSIIDLSERGAQPMASEDGDVIVCFNGEIYNYEQLRTELEAEGCRFRSTSDTEVLLHLYARRGRDMLSALRGMFAFAIVDLVERRMFVARDPYGIKPLYLADHGDAAYVASEVKALRAAGIARRPCPEGVVGFLLFGSVPEPCSWYAGVRALPAGHYAFIDRDGVHAPVRYASIAGAWADACRRRERVPQRDIELEVADALRDSVRHHLVADVPVGAFLSAGVDSTTLVALMREAQETVRTVTLTTPEFRGEWLDEAPWAERIAERYGARHSTRVITADEFQRDVPQILADMDQPSIDGFNTWLVSRTAVESGLKVAVSGLGGDELFGGYHTFDRVPRWHAAMRIPARLPRLGVLARRAMVVGDMASKLGVSTKLAGMLELGGTIGGAYFLARGLFMPWELPALIGEELAREGLARLDPVAHCNAVLEPDPEGVFARIATLEASLYMRNQLLRDSDWASMAHSLEVRVPLVDFQLLERVAPYASQLSGRAGKRMMGRTPALPLPDELVGRVKSGFGLPLREWLSHPAVGLDAYRRVPDLAADGVGYARRLAYSLVDALA
jgi:asparagine synthase (glutamine-hydrolysing)